MLLVVAGCTAGPDRGVRLPPTPSVAKKKPVRPLPHLPSTANRVPFLLHLAGLASPYSTMSAFVLPHETLAFSVSGDVERFEATAGGGRLATITPVSWQWTAPGEPGIHRIRIRALPSGKILNLRVFVMRPYNGEHRIGDQLIGRYVPDAKDGDPAWQPPRGFVVVTEHNVDTPVSPSFRLREFLTKDGAAFPRVLALQTALLIRLEHVMELLVGEGIEAPAIHVMSGYRTPAYNGRIGNETSMSRHLYGDAADIFVDRDGDGKQDDMTGDGRSTIADAKKLMALIEKAEAAGEPWLRIGGLRAYGPNKAHGPFVHVDSRGKRARW